MEFHPLRVFLTVASEKSLSHAAPSSSSPGPAISLSIHASKPTWASALIEHLSKGMALTDAGQIVTNRGCPLFDAYFLKYALRKYQELQSS